MKCVHKAIRHFKARNWAELTFAKTSGMVTRERDKKDQSVNRASPVTIPEIIAGRISAPVSFSFLLVAN